MVKEGWKPHNSVKHRPNMYVWHPESIKAGGNYRFIYYASVVGGDVQAEVGDEIRSLRWEGPYTTTHRVTGPLVPRLFQKLKQSNKTRIVDINITIEALRFARTNEVEVIHLITGDGDFADLVLELMRTGKRVQVAALSNGLSPALPNICDDFSYLDRHYFSGPAE